MGRCMEIRTLVSEEDRVGTGKASFFKEAGKWEEETKMKKQGVKIQNI